MIMKYRTVQFIMMLLLTATLSACGDFEWFPEPKTANQTPNNPDTSKLMGGAIQGKTLSLTPTVSTLAGSFSGVDGTGTTASFGRPLSVVSDGTNLYVADYGSCTIRKVAIATGVVTTLAGSAGNTGSTDGVGSAARFNGPNGIATDGTNLYVTDGDDTIRKITIATGEVSTMAGNSGASGSTDGTGTAARFKGLSGITTDGTYLYVTEGLGGNSTASFSSTSTSPFTGLNNSIRKIEIASGAVTTLAGSAGNAGATDGTGSAARFSAPTGITTDGTNLYVTDSGNKTIRKIEIASGTVTTLAGSAGVSGTTDDTGAAARFSAPLGITVAGTTLYLTDDTSIRTVDVASAAVTTLAGSTAGLTRPAGIASDGTSLLVADATQIRKVAIASGSVTTLAGSGIADGTGTGARFTHPAGITTDGTNIYTLDGATVRRTVIATGVVTTMSLSGDANGTALGFSPGDITTDGSNLFVTDASNNTIRKIVVATGVVSTLAGSAGTTGTTDGTGTAARFVFPLGITTDSTNLYVTDFNSIRKVVISTGAVTTLAGQANAFGSTDGTGTAARFQNPWGITTDGTYLFVTDLFNRTIRKISIATGEVTTLAGSAEVSGTTDGTGAAARFLSPSGITTDGTNLYVIDNWRIRKVVISTGEVTGLIGSASASGAADGTASTATFSTPERLTTDGTSLFVTDDRMIRKIR